MSDVNKLESESKIENMLVMDIMIGTGRANMGGEYLRSIWGYSNKPVGSTYRPPDGAIGTIAIIENNTRIDVSKSNTFLWLQLGADYIGWDTYSFKDEDSYSQSIELLENKVLYVTVNGVIYNLGKSSFDIRRYLKKYQLFAQYFNIGAKELGVIMKQNIGNTLRFCLNWK
ncbi:hypothetical protein Xsto_00440 [Xenorhabdus stockiae]|uniref:DUF7823 domain-containing protein n=1 Tax=Xenorhabdus stockiae TaxID=351614 RepID=A0A2D0KUT8_9GAMM|nr:hypothetical protein [Xenorhabdus stockiae]PHM67161.1 hypothetical protein Xsto_00440 [Xenorhabdus stockiae]